MATERSIILALKHTAEQHILMVVTHDPGINALTAIAEATKAFTESASGQRFLKLKDRLFLWGDIPTELPKAFFQPQGIQEIKSMSSEDLIIANVTESVLDYLF